MLVFMIWGHNTKCQWKQFSCGWVGKANNYKVWEAVQTNQRKVLPSFNSWNTLFFPFLPHSIKPYFIPCCSWVLISWNDHVVIGVQSQNARFKMSVKWGIFQWNKIRKQNTPQTSAQSRSLFPDIFYFLIYPTMQCNSQALCFYGYWSKLCHFLSTNIWLDDVYLTYLSPTLCFHWFLYNCSCKFLCCLLKLLHQLQ